MPEISVVVPVYKVEKYLNRCVDSILAQTFTDFDLILVDDGSPDNCGQICEDYAKKDKRVIVIHRENGGLSAARNSGIDWVFNNHLTEWITFIDSDDWVHPDYLKILFEVNLKNDTDISIGGFTPAYDDTEFCACGAESRIVNPEDFWVENQGNATIAWGKLYRTFFFESIRYPEGKLHEDEFTTFKLLFSQKSISVTADKLYMYYQASASIMRSTWTSRKLDLLEGYEEQLLYFKANGYKRAFKESKKLYIFAIKKNLKEIKQSEDKKANKKMMMSLVKQYLYKRYHSKLLSAGICSRIYIRKLIIEQFLSIRINVINLVFKEDGFRGVIKKLLRR